MQVEPAFLSAYDNIGGAAKACYRLHSALRMKGIRSSLVVQHKMLSDPSVVQTGSDLYSRIRRKMETLPLKKYSLKDSAPFNAQVFTNYSLERNLRRLDPNLIHLHWVGHGLIALHQLTHLSVPLVWTMHDSGVFTGGCNVPHSCNRFQEACGQCPILGSSKNDDLSNRTWMRKKVAYDQLNIRFIAPSNWIKSRALESSLLRDKQVDVIPNCIDIGQFKPYPKLESRDKLGLPPDKKLVGFGSLGVDTDPNKGFQFFRPVIEELKAYGDLEVVIFGRSDVQFSLTAGIKTHSLGEITSENMLALAYSSCDVIVVPSMLENLPNTVMESMACGTPCVAFEVGGIPDLIDHQRNGYLAKPYEVADLVQGVRFLLETENPEGISSKSREKIRDEFNLEIVTKKHLSLYSEVLDLS